jgi:hypothetical protein
MQRFIPVLLFFAIHVMPCEGIADDSVSQSDVRNILTKNDFIKGEFEQERILKGINRPIHSTGKFAIWRNNGIYWETSKPLFQAASFLKDNVYYWSNENTYELVRDGVFRVNEKISQIMLAFFTANFEQIEKDFNIDLAITDKTWTIVLTPSNIYVSKAIERVVIGGMEHIENVVLDLATGDSTKIQLHVTAEGNEPDMESKGKLVLEDVTGCCAR